MPPLVPLDGETLKWAIGGLFGAVGWLIGRHDKLRSARERQRREREQAEEQRKREQAAARQAARALAEAVASKNVEIDALHRDIDYYRSQYDKLFAAFMRTTQDQGAHG